MSSPGHGINRRIFTQVVQLYGQTNQVSPPHDYVGFSSHPYPAILLFWSGVAAIAASPSRKRGRVPRRSVLYGRRVRQQFGNGYIEASGTIEAASVDEESWRALYSDGAPKIDIPLNSLIGRCGGEA